MLRSKRVMQVDLEVPALVGQLIVGGFAGGGLSPTFARELAAKRRGGAILFKRNLPSVEDAADLCAAILEAAPRDLPPFIGSTGREVASTHSAALGFRDARACVRGSRSLLWRRSRGRQRACRDRIQFEQPTRQYRGGKPGLASVRCSGRTRTVMRFGVAYVRGLQNANVLACGKHFPGHGDTRVDSHLELPVVMHPRNRLDEIDLPPFRAAIGAGVAALLSAHVVYERIEKGIPATLSRSICASLLRAELGFEGVLFSDDLEMKAITARWPIEDAAVEAIWAGCDAVLVCSDEDAQVRVHDALTRAAEKDPRFRDRCAEAATRVLRLRRLCPPRPITAREGLSAIVGGPASQEVLARIAAKQSVFSP